MTRFFAFIHAPFLKAIILISLSISAASTTAAQEVNKPETRAQETAAPTDLTILSTNEEDVQFIIVDETENEGEAAADEQIEEAAAEALAEDVIDAETDTETDALADNSSDIIAVTTTEETQSNEALDDANAPTQTTRITRRNIKDVGLASIGIEQIDAHLDDFDSLLWRGVDVKTALAMIDAVSHSHSSPSLAQTSYQVIARQAVPPQGAAEDPIALLSARMDYLARAGRSQSLAEIIRQLPDKPEWQSWKIWLIYYDLMMREDEAACKLAAEKVKTSLEDLWQKTNLVCQILTGNEAMAAFSSDVLKASGLVDDNRFFELVDVLLGRRDTITQSEQPVSVMHLILMDAAHIDISAAQIKSLDPSYGRAANALRYLSDEARQSLGLANLKAGLLDIQGASSLFLASVGTVDNPLKAMTRRMQDASELSSVQLYLALHKAVAASKNTTISARSDNESVAAEAETALDDELSSMVSQALRLEVADGDGQLWLPFYAPLLAEALSLSDMTKTDKAIQLDHALTSAMTGAELVPLPVDGQAIARADHIRVILDQNQPYAGRIESLTALKLEALLPLMGEAPAGETDWLTAYLESEAAPLASYQHLPQTGLMALADVAASGQKAQTLLLANILIGTHPLAQLAPQDLRQIITALSDAGLAKTASSFASEALAAHMLVMMTAQQESAS